MQSFLACRKLSPSRTEGNRLLHVTPPALHMKDWASADHLETAHLCRANSSFAGRNRIESVLAGVYFRLPEMSNPMCWRNVELQASDLCKFASRKVGWLLACRFLAAAVVFILLPILVRAQQIPESELKFDTHSYTPSATLRIQRNVIQVDVDVVVRDRKGRAVEDLKQQDFRVYDKGKEVNITQFTIESAVPQIVSGQATSSTSTSPASAAASAPPAAANHQRFIALFFDDQNTPFSDLVYARQAAEKFVRSQLHAGDKVGVFTASGATGLDFTDDTHKLIMTIASLRSRGVLQRGGFGPCAPMGPYQAYLIWDRQDAQAESLAMAREELCHCPGCSELTLRQMARQRAERVLIQSEQDSRSALSNLEGVIRRLSRKDGRRVTLLVSSGFLTSSLQEQLNQVAADALHAEVVINSLSSEGLVAYSPGGDLSERSPSGALLSQDLMYYAQNLSREQQEALNDVMDGLAWDTGGIFFHNNNDLDFGLREMAAAPDVSYRLGFSPANLNPDGKFHDLKVKLATPGSFKIQARRGYFATTEAAQKAEGEVNKLNDEVMTTENMNAIPVEVGAPPGRLASGGMGLQISLRVDLKGLSFQKSQGRDLDKLNVVSALFNSQRNFVTGEMGAVDMALKNNSLKDLTKRGLNTRMVLEAPRGDYHLRVVMEEAGSGKMFAVTQTADIP